MRTAFSRALRLVAHRRAVAIGVLIFAALALLLAAAPAFAGDVYGNIGPAPQVAGGGIFGRYPITSYQLDQYFPAISVGVLSGVDVSGLAPMIAYFFAQLLWLITAFLANGVITLFAFAFNLDLVNGNGSPGSRTTSCTRGGWKSPPHGCRSTCSTGSCSPPGRTSTRVTSRRPGRRSETACFGSSYRSRSSSRSACAPSTPTRPSRSRRECACSGCRG